MMYENDMKFKFQCLQAKFQGLPVVKNLPSNTGDEGSIPGQETGIPCAEGLLGPHALEPETMKDPTVATKT